MSNYQVKDNHIAAEYDVNGNVITQDEVNERVKSDIKWLKENGTALSPEQVTNLAKVPILESQLDDIDLKKANKTETYLKINGININDFDEETRQTFLEAQGIDVNYVLGSGNVKPNNTTFFIEEKGSNLLSPTKIDYGTWLGNSLSGTTATSTAPTNAGWNSTKAIEIEPNTSYVFQFDNSLFTSSNANYSYWYDSNGVAISTFAFGQATVSPSNAKYVRMSFKGSTSGVIYGVYKATSVVPKEEYRESTYTFDNSFLNIPNEKKMTKNLFNENTITLNSYLPGGNLGGNSNGWKVSDFITVNGNATYTLSQDYGLFSINPSFCWFYDENKSVISAITTNPFTTPSNAKYVRFSIQNKVNYMQLEQGASIGYYIPHGYEEDYRELLKSPLLGKKYCPIGDSITASGWGYDLARQTGMVINSYNAIGGSTVSGAYDGDERNNMCGTVRINATPTDTEIITIMGGSNDWSQQSQGSGIPVGNMSDLKIGEDKTLSSITFTGCFKLMLNRLYKRCPNAQIFILEQTYRYLEDTDRTVPLDVFRKRTLEIAYEYGYPVISMKQKCGFNEMNYQDYYIDIIHPNGTTGKKRIIEVVKSGILSTIH